MLFQIRERLFSLMDTFDIVDENNTPVYQVRSEFLTLGKKLNLYDMDGRQLAHIEQRLLSLMAEYDIYRDGAQVADVRQNFSLFAPKYVIESVSGTFEMQGDWLSLSYEITQNGMEVASINRQFALLANCYGVNVLDGADIPLILSIAIVMEEVTQRRN